MRTINKHLDFTFLSWSIYDIAIVSTDLKVLNIRWFSRSFDLIKGKSYCIFSNKYIVQYIITQKVCTHPTYCTHNFTSNVFFIFALFFFQKWAVNKLYFMLYGASSICHTWNMHDHNFFFTNCSRTKIRALSSIYLHVLRCTWLPHKL